MIEEYVYEARDLYLPEGIQYNEIFIGERGKPIHNTEAGYFSPCDITNTIHIQRIYSTRYEIVKGDKNITGIKETVESISNYSGNELLICSFTFKDYTYTLFINSEKDNILGVIRSKYLTSAKLKDLNKIYLEKEYEVDSVRISKGKLTT